MAFRKKQINPPKTEILKKSNYCGQSLKLALTNSNFVTKEELFKQISMNNLINVFIIENEPITLNAILDALNTSDKSKPKFNIKIAKNYTDALGILENRGSQTAFDLIMLNIDIPFPSEEESIFREELGTKIKSLHPSAKFIICCGRCDNYRIHYTLKKIDPEGFFIKSEMDHAALKKAIYMVLSKQVYYSNSVIRSMKRRIINDIVLDKADRQILYFLSKGVKTKDLSRHIYLSDGGIQRRKRRLKELFDVDERNDMKLLKLAEEKGFI